MRAMPLYSPKCGLLCLALAALIAACLPSGLAQETAPEAKSADKASDRFPVPPAAALAAPEKQIKDV